MPKPDKPTPQRTTLILDPELHKRLRILAVERGVTFTTLVAEALTQYLERESRRGGAKK